MNDQALDQTGDDLLDVRSAASLAGVSEKTIRRYHKDGRLAAVVERGRRGDQYKFLRSDIEAVFTGVVATNKPLARSPLEDVRTELEALRKTLADQAEATAKMERERTAIIEAQSRTIDELRAEVRDSRAQLAQLHEQVVRALPAPKKWWWLRK